VATDPTSARLERGLGIGQTAPGPGRQPTQLPNGRKSRGRRHLGGRRHHVPHGCRRRGAGEGSRRSRGVGPDGIPGQGRDPEPRHGHELDDHDAHHTRSQRAHQGRQGQKETGGDVEGGVETGTAGPEKPEGASSGERQEPEDHPGGQQNVTAPDMDRGDHEDDADDVLAELVDAEGNRSPSPWVVGGRAGRAGTGGGDGSSIPLMRSVRRRRPMSPCPFRRRWPRSCLLRGPS
jgi:hypothetical protein